MNSLGSWPRTAPYNRRFLDGKLWVARSELRIYCLPSNCRKLKAEILSDANSCPVIVASVPIVYCAIDEASISTLTFAAEEGAR